jgi:hypothetical protein
MPHMCQQSFGQSWQRLHISVAQCPELTTILIPILRQCGIDGLTVCVEQ